MKTRDISIYDFFNMLQKEWIICELRIKIYPFIKHKEYWQFIADKKKEKILDIAKRNKLPTIFDSEDIKQNISRSIIPEKGFPNIFYKDQLQREQQEKWDMINYYSKGSDIRIDLNKKIHICKVNYVDVDKKEVHVIVEGNLVIVPFSEATRIL